MGARRFLILAMPLPSGNDILYPCHHKSPACMESSTTTLSSTIQREGTVFSSLIGAYQLDINTQGGCFLRLIVNAFSILSINGVFYERM